jgi:hypothetical protein
MQNTSRRSFGKLIAGAVAALPLASCTSPSTGNQNAEAVAQNTQSATQTRQQRAQATMVSHQDTPPPIILEEGSVKLDVEDNSLLGSGDEFPKDFGGNYRWQYKNDSKDIYIVGLQIVSVSGRVWFYLDRDYVENGDKVPLNVVIETEGSGSSKKEVVLSTEKNGVTLGFPQKRVLKKRHQSGQPAEPGYGGRIRYRYHDDSGKETGTIQGITVFLGPIADKRIITRFHRDDLGPAMDGIRLMVWFEQI